MSKIEELRHKISAVKKRVTDKIASTEKQLEEADKVLGQLTPMTEALGKVEGMMGTGAPAPQARKIGPRTGPCDLKESAPVGSFDRVEDDLRVALNDQRKVLWPELVDPYPYICYVFPEHVIMSLNNKYYESAYTMDINGKAAFGKPVEVEQMYIPSKGITMKESNVTKGKKTFSQEIKESGIELVGQSKDQDLDVAEFISLQESKYDADSGELEIVIVESGTNERKGRHYPESTVREAGSIFSGMKMYLNHPTKKEEQERPERDITQWASTIVESFSRDVVLQEAGGSRGATQAVGRVAIHDPWLRERLKDPVVRQHIGVSMLTGGKITRGKVNGKEMEIVESIVPRRQNGPASVDWVTEAGARGRVSRLLKESQSETKEKEMDLKEATFADLKRENPTLVKELTESIRVELSQSDDAKKKDAELKEAQGKLAAAELKEKQTAQASKVTDLLKESKLPDIAKSRVAKRVAEKVFADEKELKEAFDLAHKEEAEYVNQFTSKGKIRMGAPAGKTDGEGSTLRESAAESLAERMGLNKKETDDKE